VRAGGIQAFAGCQPTKVAQPSGALGQGDMLTAILPCAWRWRRRPWPSRALLPLPRALMPDPLAVSGIPAPTTVFLHPLPCLPLRLLLLLPSRLPSRTPTRVRPPTRTLPSCAGPASSAPFCRGRPARSTRALLFPLLRGSWLLLWRLLPIPLRHAESPAAMQGPCFVTRVSQLLRLLTGCVGLAGGNSTICFHKTERMSQRLHLIKYLSNKQHQSSPWEPHAFKRMVRNGPAPFTTQLAFVLSVVKIRRP
jgi:hypothetical protein